MHLPCPYTGGALNKLFDLLDERTLKLPEIAEMLELLGRNWNGTAGFPVDFSRAKLAGMEDRFQVNGGQLHWTINLDLVSLQLTKSCKHYLITGLWCQGLHTYLYTARVLGLV